MVITTAIVEDSSEDSATLSKHLKRFFAENTADTVSIELFTYGEKFLAGFKSGEYDIVFLDINLGGRNKSGIEIARKIRETDQRVILLFETSLEKYAIAGYEVNALDFLIKPISYPSLALRMEKAMKIIHSYSRTSVAVPVSSGILKVPVSDIKYIEAKGHKITYHLADRVIEAKGTLNLGELEEQLSKFNFFRCNSCYLVNLERVVGIEKYECIFDDERIQISHPKRKEFLKAFTEFVLGESQ